MADGKARVEVRSVHWRLGQIRHGHHRARRPSWSGDRGPLLTIAVGAFEHQEGALSDEG